MNNIELDDLGDRGEDRPPEDGREEEETGFDDHWGSENVLDMSIDPNIRGNFDAARTADRELGVSIAGKKRTITWAKKAILRKLNINLKKGDGPNSDLLFERLGLTEGKKSNINGAEVDGVKIIVQKGKILVFTEDAKVSKLNKFNSLVRKAQEEHSTTPVAFMEETLDITVDEDLERSVLKSSLERLDEDIFERADGIAAELTENELREFRGILAVRLPTVEQQIEGGITPEDRIDAIRAEETNWRDLV